MQSSTRAEIWEKNVKHEIIVFSIITINTINNINLETPGRRTPGPFTGRSMSSMGESGLLRNGGRSGSLDIKIIIIHKKYWFLISLIIMIIITIIIIMIMLIIYLTLQGCSGFPQVHLSAKSEFFPQLLFAAPNIINHNKPWYNESTHYGYWSLIMWIDHWPLLFTVRIVIIIMS